jgi:hypothetical protein
MEVAGGSAHKESRTRTTTSTRTSGGFKFANGNPMNRMMFVKSIRVIAACMLALVWAPLTSHCQLESIPGLEFLHCASEATDSGCCDDSCTSVESGAYKVPDYQNPVPPIQWSIVLQFSALVPAEEGQPPAKPADAPLELLPTWQFSLRTALPVRAPSLVS